MAIGNGDFTAKEKSGFYYHFQTTDTWEAVEPSMIAWLKLKGLEWKNEKTSSNQQFKDDLQAVVNDLKDDPTQMPAVKAVLEIP